MILRLSRLVRRPATIAAACTAAVLCSSVMAFGPRDLWMAPAPDAAAARASLARATADLADGRAAQALPVFTAAAGDPAIGLYAQLYAGRAHLALGQTYEAARFATQVQASASSSALAAAAGWLAVDAAVAAGDRPAEFNALSQLTARQTAPSAATTLRLLKAAVAVSDRDAATRAFHTLYYSHPAAPETADALAAMKAVGVLAPAVTRETFARDLSRAEQLFAARQYTDARAAFVAVKPFASGAEQELVALRLAESDLFLRKHAAAEASLRAYLDTASARIPEARYHHLTALRELGRMAEYHEQLRAFVDSGADPVLAERALNDLGTFHILANDDGKAAEVFTDQYRPLPAGRVRGPRGMEGGLVGVQDRRVRGDDSAVRIGGRHAPARGLSAVLAVLGRAIPHAAGASRSGAPGLSPSHRGLPEFLLRPRGHSRSRADSGRDASCRRRAGVAGRLEWPATIAPSPRPANAGLIEDLLAAGMYDEAVAELRLLQASGAGSPLVDATVAYALNRQRKLRPAITAMRRAYPQFMAEGGEALPEEILTVIFPIDHWDLIQSHAAKRGLDRFMVAALVAQESTFQADVKSVANAWGLMQIIPATGRRYAASLGIRPFSTNRLVDPETNVRIGTTYFSDLLKRFGDAAPALAAYNAGEQRVSRWLADRPGLDRDEFIDDIPFPETQNYVKRIIGTTEDYRRLYR